MLSKLLAAALTATSLVSSALGAALTERDLTRLVGRSAYGKRTTALPPSRDPFYSVPKNVSSYRPGDIISHREVNVTGINATTSYQFLYRTTDSLNNATAAVTTLIIPFEPDFEKLVSYQIPYDSPDNDCSPSYTLQSGGFTLANDIPTLLNKGWLVLTPDYEGPLAAFTAGVISGRATLDSVRAALRSGPHTGVCPWARLAMWGYSGGALASEWAGELQRKYAPELAFQGAALGGLTPNVTSVALAVNNRTLSGLIPAGILGLSAAYPNLSAFVDEKLVPAKRNDFYSVKNDCIATEVLAFHDQDFSTYFQDGLQDLTSPLAVSVINAGGVMGLHGQPRFPLYVYKSVFDEVSPVNDTDALVNKYCSHFAPSINYVRFNYGNHLEAADDGRAGALAFLDSVLSGTPQTSGCNITTVQK